MNNSDIYKIIQYPVLDLFKCGSRVVCAPPVMDTDEDWMILVNELDIEFIYLRLEGMGFTLGGSRCINESTTGDPQSFWSFTKDDINLLITSNRDFYNKFSMATKVCKALNLLDKEKRIILFQAILYENVEQNLTL